MPLAGQDHNAMSTSILHTWYFVTNNTKVITEYVYDTESFQLWYRARSAEPSAAVPTNEQ